MINTLMDWNGLHGIPSLGIARMNSLFQRSGRRSSGNGSDDGSGERYIGLMVQLHGRGQGQEHLIMIAELYIINRI